MEQNQWRGERCPNDATHQIVGHTCRQCPSRSNGKQVRSVIYCDECRTMIDASNYSRHVKSVHQPNVNSEIDQLKNTVRALENRISAVESYVQNMMHTIHNMDMSVYALKSAIEHLNMRSKPSIQEGNIRLKAGTVRQINSRLCATNGIDVDVENDLYMSGTRIDVSKENYRPTFGTNQRIEAAAKLAECWFSVFLNTGDLPDLEECIIRLSLDPIAIPSTGAIYDAISSKYGHQSPIFHVYNMYRSCLVLTYLVDLNEEETNNWLGNIRTAQSKVSPGIVPQHWFNRVYEKKYLSVDDKGQALREELDRYLKGSSSAS